jgi:predicted N-formylglutamate amidohydrolase
MSARAVALVLTCEHGGNRVPHEWAPLFAGARTLLASHRGWDPGALAVARALARRLSAPLVVAEITRLLVDLNRSEDNPAVVSRFTRDLPPDIRERLLARWHRPHRARVLTEVARVLARRRAVLHVAVHSFTPVLDGVVRTADVGLLYDPSRARERDAAARWRAVLRELAPELRVRMNYPYRGTSDGLTTALRRLHGDRDYAGIELELSQGIVADRRRFAALQRVIAGSLGAVLSPARTAGRRP